MPRGVRQDAPRDEVLGSDGGIDVLLFAKRVEPDGGAWTGLAQPRHTVATRGSKMDRR